jgi:very-short-patch-repair endonuclease
MTKKGTKLTEEEKKLCRIRALKKKYGDNVKYLSETHPELVREWHPTKNGNKNPSEYTSSSDSKIMWICPHTCLEGCLHEFEATIGNRAKNGSGCPYCSRRKICIHQSIVHTHPEIAKEFHPTKNGDIKVEEIAYGSKKKIWWLCVNKCSEGCLHEYECAPLNRCGINKQNCPYCCNQQICIHSSIKFTHPEVAKEWHPEKNGDNHPSHYSRGNTTEKFWWICSKKHEWQAIIKNRCLNSSGCPSCKHKTEAKLFEYLSKIIDDLTQHNRKLLKGREYDFESTNRKLIVELDGPHHFKNISNWKNDSALNQEIDVEKMKVAISKNYKIIRILQEDVLNNNEEWLNVHLKPHIINCIQQITYICPDNPDIYNNHKNLMESENNLNNPDI